MMETSPDLQVQLAKARAQYSDAGENIVEVPKQVSPDVIRKQASERSLLFKLGCYTVQ
jgi:hypothetical protein